MEQKPIEELHRERTIWINKLKFYRDDLKVMKLRLEEVVVKNNLPEFLKQTEHFQNQFMIQQSAIDKLKHEINHEENKMVNAILDNPTASDHRKANDDKELREAVLTFEKLFAELRAEYIQFLTKWM